MTRRSKPILSGALAILLAASASHAESPMDACIDAFVAEHVPKNRSVKIRKAGPSSAPSPRGERITLTAKGARTGTPIAAATCIVSGMGKSVTLQEVGATVAANAH